MSITVLSEPGRRDVRPLREEAGALWLAPEDLEAATGWTIKPEGLCRGPVCVPVPPAARDRFVGPDGVNAAAFWERMNAPVAVSDAGDVWVLGEPADQRREQLESLEAPDFALPDLAGRTRRLSEFRGRKVFLATWASW